MNRRVKFWIKTFVAVIRNIRSLISLRKEVLLDDTILNFSRYSRLYNYHRGVKARVSEVFSSYGVSEEIISKIEGKAVIDIGANIGEFSIFLRKYGNHDGEIVAIEPDPIEFSSLGANAERFGFRAVNSAVSSRSGKMRFILNNEDADSRLDFSNESGSKKNTILVDSARLNEILFDLRIGEVGLVKLEAEGYEPEVLQGIDFSEIDIKYFAIDCGPERPPYNEATLVSCLNLLLKNGYELINYNPSRHSILMMKSG